MTGWGDIPDRILAALREYGPMTGQELAEFVPVDPEIINKTLRRMREPSLRKKPLGVRRVHISAWTPDVEGQRNYPRPIYSAGDGQDKPRPRRKTRNEIARANARKNRNKTRMNFVFNLGIRA